MGMIVDRSLTACGLAKMRRQRGKRLYDSVELGRFYRTFRMDYSYLLNMNLFLNISLADLFKLVLFSENKIKSQWLHRHKVPLHGQVIPSPFYAWIMIIIL
jgi:hypothetical protein